MTNDLHNRLAKALNRISSATNVARSRANDEQRAERNGTTLETQLEGVVIRLEAEAAALETLNRSQQKLRAA